MEAVIKRGRTVDAVVNPKNYFPFSRIPDRVAFEDAWQSNPHWVLANMAHAAYCDPKYLKELFSKFGAKIQFYESKPDKNGIRRGREAFLVSWDDRAILAFRGTEAGQKMKWRIPEKIIAAAKRLKVDLPSEVKTVFPTDILDDLDFGKVAYGEEGCRSEVHGGFLKATEELWPDILQDLNQLALSDPTQLFATGHSLGAAMAVCAGLMTPFKKIVTFGEPSVGNDLENNIDPHSHIRYVNGNDPVTKIVPEALFRHHGELVEIQDIDGPDFRFDHSIVNYAEILAPAGA